MPVAAAYRRAAYKLIVHKLEQPGHLAHNPEHTPPKLNSTEASENGTSR